MTPCVEWTGAVFKRSGYGKRWYKGQTLNAHRVTYIEAYGLEAVEGLDVDHTCNNRLCVNLDHLVAKTHKENVARSMAPTAVNGRKTHCDSGHEFTPENTYVAYGYRYCKACRRLRQAEYVARKREAIHAVV